MSFNLGSMCACQTPLFRTSPQKNKMKEIDPKILMPVKGQQNSARGDEPKR